MNIHKLINRFTQAGPTTIGNGPRHPISPNPKSLPDIREYFATYPMLRQDQGYVDFLECYSAATADGWLDEKVFIHIYGFDTNITVHLNATAEVPPDKKLGFMPIAYLQIIKKTQRFDDGYIYNYDITGKRPFGIYQRIDSTELELESNDYEWYCDSFLGWLEDIIDKKGLIFLGD